MEIYVAGCFDEIISVHDSFEKAEEALTIYNNNEKAEPFGYYEPSEWHYYDGFWIIKNTLNEISDWRKMSI